MVAGARMDLSNSVLTGEELQRVVQEETMGGIETANRFRKRWLCIRRVPWGTKHMTVCDPRCHFSASFVVI